ALPISCVAVRVNRGSTTLYIALRFRFASTAHLNPQGWFSAGFPPMINIMSVFLMSIQPLDNAHAAHGLHHEIVELVGVGAAAGEGDGFAAVYRAALGILLDEGRVARLLGPMGDLVDGLLPRDVFPVVGAGAPYLRFQQPAIVEDVLLQRRPLRTERATIDGMIGVAFDMHYLRSDVLRLVADGVDDHAATHRAVRACAAGFGGAGNLELLSLRVKRRSIEAECGESHDPR